MSWLYSIQEQVISFASLSYEKKKQKVLLLLENIYQTNDIFARLYKHISLQSHAVTDKVLELIYQWILEIAQQLNMIKKWHALEHIHALQNKLISLRQAEQKEELQDWDVEDLLSGI